MPGRILFTFSTAVREEYRNGASGSGGNPPPVTIHTWLERFNKQKPRTFEKAVTPVDAENWISHIDKDLMKWAAALQRSRPKNFRWGLHKSDPDRILSKEFTDLLQVADASSQL
ncbi:hypothetical protein Tco_0675730 [Tanacetum coccineum]